MPDWKWGRAGEWSTLWQGSVLFPGPPFIWQRPCKFVCFNFSPWMSTTDLLTSKDIETQSENKEEKILVECLNHNTGTLHPPTWIHTQHIKENPVCRMVRLPEFWFKQKLGMWIWMKFCFCCFALFCFPSWLLTKNHFIQGKYWLTS